MLIITSIAIHQLKLITPMKFILTLTSLMHVWRVPMQSTYHDGKASFTTTDAMDEPRGTSRVFVFNEASREQ